MNNIQIQQLYTVYDLGYDKFLSKETPPSSEEILEEGLETAFTISGGGLSNFSFNLSDDVIIGGKLASDLAFLENGVLTQDLINEALNTQTKQILGQFTFGSSGAIKIAIDDNNGIWISPNGILGKNGGSTTFSLTNSGNATFRGEILAGSIISCDISANRITSGYLSADRIAAGSITADKLSISQLSAISSNLGTITAGTITLPTGGWIKGGQTDYNTGIGFFLGYSGGAYKFSIGNPSGTYLTWDGSTLTIRGNIYATGGQISANYISGGTLQGINIFGVTITGSTITGSTVQSSSGNQRVVLNASYDRIEFYYGGSLATYLQATGGSNLFCNGVFQCNVLNVGTSSAYNYINGSLYVGTIYPLSSGSYNLGSSSYYWNNLYLNYLRFNPSYGTIYWGSDTFLAIGLPNTSSAQIYKHLLPNSASAQLNLGSDTQYFNEVNAKYFTKRGGFGVFDEGVELQDGRKVSDLEAIKNLKAHPKMKSQYGVPRIDPQTLPKAVYKPKTSPEGEDGEDLGAMISIIIGAIKELSQKVEVLEEKLK